MNLTTLATLLLITLAAFVIWQHIAIANMAERVARQRCQQEGVTLLDQTIVMRAFRITKSVHSLFALERHFRFEFSTMGDVRYQGDIIFRGKRFVSISLQPFKSNNDVDPSLH